MDKSPIGQKPHRTKATRIKIKRDKSPIPENIIILTQMLIPFLLMRSHDTSVENLHSVHVIMLGGGGREKPQWTKASYDKSPNPEIILIF